MQNSPSRRSPRPPAFADSKVRAAEVGGLIVGALIAGDSPAGAAGIAVEDADGAMRASLRTLAEEGAAALREGRLFSSLWLPDDAVPLERRVEALVAWVRGFLSGLGQAGERLGALDAESHEALRDLEAISRGAALEENASGAEERAYAELIEYVRLCTIHLYRALGRHV